MDALKLIAEFYVACEMAESTEAIAAALFAAARGAGFDHVSYQCGDVRGPARIAFSNFPSGWRRLYAERGYDRIDPILARARAAREPFLWSDPLLCAAMTPKQTRMMGEARTFRVGFGYAVPLHSSLHVRAACFFACPHGDIAVTSQRAMRTAAIITHEHVCRLSRRPALHEPSPRLSPRECDCLGLYAQGLTDAEIAARLDIRVPTVRRHFDQARLRLGVATRQEALVAALLTRQVEPGCSRAFPLGNMDGQTDA